MGKIIVFNLISIDGYFEGPDRDITWHNAGDREFNDFAEKQMKKSNVRGLIFGRVTYDLMASYWPTQDAIKNDPIIAKYMNEMPKFVVSRKMKKADWSNTTLVHDIKEIAKLRRERGDFLVFGSSDLCVSLIEAGLLDEIRVMVNPIVLSQGKTFLSGLKERYKLNLTKVDKFKSGNVLLSYDVEGN